MAGAAVLLAVSEVVALYDGAFLRIFRLVRGFYLLRAGILDFADVALTSCCVTTFQGFY